MKIPKLIVITPVKNSIQTTLETSRAISNSNVVLTHIIFNDFSSLDTRLALEENRVGIGYELVNLEEITQTPSPNYKLVLHLAQQEALAAGLPLLVVESDVLVRPDTIKILLDFLNGHPKTGLVGSVTVDD